MGKDKDKNSSVRLIETDEGLMFVAFGRTPEDLIERVKYGEAAVHAEMLENRMREALKKAS